MPRVDLRDYRKARTPFGSLMRLFRYFKHCRLILICAVVSMWVGVHMFRKTQDRFVLHI